MLYLVVGINNDPTSSGTWTVSATVFKPQLQSSAKAIFCGNTTTGASLNVSTSSVMVTSCYTSNGAAATPYLAIYYK